MSVVNFILTIATLIVVILIVIEPALLVLTGKLKKRMDRHDDKELRDYFLKDKATERKGEGNAKID